MRTLGMLQGAHDQAGPTGVALAALALAVCALEHPEWAVAVRSMINRPGSGMPLDTMEIVTALRVSSVSEPQDGAL